MFFFGPYDNDTRFPTDVGQFLRQDRLTWSQMESLLITFRDKRADLTIGTFGTFLYIARRTTRVLSGQIPILTISDVADQLQISYPTAARHCDLLGAGVGGKGGLGWLRKEQASDKRSKCVMLSDAGVDVLSDAIKRVLY